MAARQDDKGFEIADCRLWIVDFGIQGFRDGGIEEFNSGNRSAIFNS
jgi:hypothetical protein